VGQGGAQENLRQTFESLCPGYPLRFSWGLACQVKQEVGRRMRPAEADSPEERRRKLLHLLEECRVLYFGQSKSRARGGTRVYPLTI
jgi:hypothetical protein